jgi:hypothetical protein
MMMMMMMMMKDSMMVTQSLYLAFGLVVVTNEPLLGI